VPVARSATPDRDAEGCDALGPLRVTIKPLKRTERSERSARGLLRVEERTVRFFVAVRQTTHARMRRVFAS
jgi:hypothetical protein